MNTLFIRLEGPLQSWGVRARWGERDTALEPTKSGVVGLLACALGWGTDRDVAIRDLGNSVLFGVRVDRPGRLLTDYHTVHGGVLSAAGPVKVTAKTGMAETVESRRMYLADASFLAALIGDESVVERLATALQDPVWPIFLGRMSCPPSAPPFAGTGTFDSLTEALRSREPYRGERRVRASIEVGPGEGVPRMDSVVALRHRVYAPRYARDVVLTFPDSEAGGEGGRA